MGTESLEYRHGTHLSDDRGRSSGSRDLKTGGHHHHMEDMKRRFFVSMIVTIPILLLSESIQEWFGFRLDIPFKEPVLFLLASFIYLYGGKPFLSASIAEIRSRRPGMMTLISMAISVAYFFSAATLFMEGGKTFFWELATLIDIMLIGHYIEAKSVLGAADALKGLVEMMPRKALRIEADGKREEISVNRLEPGDRILVRPGEKIPADGKVVEGESLADESFLTGESKPVEKNPGKTVYMGSTNLDGALTIVIEKSGSESYLSQVISLVEAAQKSRSKTQDLANRAAGWLFYGAVAAGAVTFGVWSVIASPMDAVLKTVTVLIIACPHALGLAVPLVVAISTSLGAREGILIRDREAFEALKDIDLICFDKTGTVTEGKLEVIEAVARGDQEQMLSLASALELSSEHSIARAIVAYGDRIGVPKLPVSDFQAYPGVGAVGTVKGRRVAVGGPRLLEKFGFDVSESLRRYQHSDATIVWVAIDDTVEGVILLGDTLRPSSPEAISYFRAMGIETWMLTGDNRAVAEEVARQSGIDHVRAGLLPDEKVRIVEEFRATGKRVAMVGDGINDAPSLLAADIGIAIGSGTDIAIQSAGIVLTRSDLMSVVKAIGLSRATYRKMVQNLWWASGYNIVAIPLAAGVAVPWGISIDPAFGAVLMSVSTVVVAVNARLLQNKTITQEVQGQ